MRNIDARANTEENVLVSLPAARIEHVYIKTYSAKIKWQLPDSKEDVRTM